MEVSTGQKEDMKERIRKYIWEEHGEEIGELAADNWLHFFKEELAVHFYNQGIEDAKRMVEQKVMAIDEDLDSLRRPVRR